MYLTKSGDRRAVLGHRQPNSYHVGGIETQEGRRRLYVRQAKPS